MDWTAADSDQHGAIHRIYSTHYYDRVSGAHLEIVSVPAFVLPARPLAQVAGGAHARASAQHFLTISAELLGSDVQLFRTAKNNQAGPRNSRATPDDSIDDEALAVELLSEKVAFDLMLGRAEHQALRRQLEAPTVPVESSPPLMQAAVDILQQAALGVLSPGIGGLILTGAGAAVGLFINRTGRVVADEIAALAQRFARTLTDIGRLQNQNEFLTLKAKSLELEKKILEQEALLRAQRVADSSEKQG